MRPVQTLLLAVAASALAAGTARADAKPHPVFSDNMVLQQGGEIVVWGKADPNERVSVSLEGKTAGGASASAAGTQADKDGNWRVKFGKQAAGTGYAMTVEGAKNKVEFKNVAVGEVWVCSGQSNMQWEFWRNNLGEQSKTVPAGAKNDNIRLMTLKRVTATTPQYDFPVSTEAREGTKGPDAPKVHYGKWLPCEPDAVQEFSAVAYYFARDLEKALKVPVGVIANSWGGMPAESYTSLEALDAEPSLKYLADRARATAKAFAEYDAAKATEAYEKALVAYEAAFAKWKDEAAKAKADGKPEPKQPSKPGKPGPTAPAANPSTPTVLYNSMVYPLLNFPVKGAIWYQGESNASRAYEYRTLYPAMIKDWRARWKSELPFVGVQLAPFRGNQGSAGVDYAELRDAQLFATKALPKVGVAVITDAGHETDIHPPQKEAVGSRLALNARALAYGEKISYTGPTLKDAKYASGTATLTFENTGGELVAKGGDAVGFTVAGKDGKFHPAKAAIKGDTVTLTSDMVPEPTAVRFGWVNFANPTLNLFGKDGLPATPFRTDDAPLTTMPPKK